jgi:hypothetical protein
VKSIVQFWARKDPNSIFIKAGGPGHWNDADMLVIGNPGLSISEQKAQMALWAIMASPLYISAEVATIPDESLRILMNEKVIAVNQDEKGKQGFVIYNEQKGRQRIWVRVLDPKDSASRIAVLFENKGTSFWKESMSVSVEMLGWTSSDEATYTVDNLYSDEDAVHTYRSKTRFQVTVDESSVEMFIFTWNGPKEAVNEDYFAQAIKREQAKLRGEASKNGQSPLGGEEPIDMGEEEQ